MFICKEILTRLHREDKKYVGCPGWDAPGHWANARPVQLVVQLQTCLHNKYCIYRQTYINTTVQ